jgi:hypothetical protein
MDRTDQEPFLWRPFICRRTRIPSGRPFGVSEVEARTFLETIEDIGTLRAERTIEIKMASPS